MITYKTKSELDSLEKVYWFLRYLVENDKGGLHKKQSVLIELRDSLGAALHLGRDDINNEVTLRGLVKNILLKSAKSHTKQYQKVESLVSALHELLDTYDDFIALFFCIDKVLIPSTQALNLVPSKHASDIAKNYAQSVLDNQGTSGLANILRDWDSITLDICLNRERDIAVELFTTVKNSISDAAKEDSAGSLAIFSSTIADKQEHNEAIVLTALVQEFERRLGQMRKQRSGQDLENATAFIFDYYGIEGADKPSHFTAAIEVDNWTKDKRGWYIGFSLKRTLRERWKQTVVDKDTLTEFHIRHIVHLICNDGDLTDNKIADMGAKRHLFFVPDESDVLKRVASDTVLSEYVRPMSSLIEFIKSV